jgi:uncharacterized protein (DUF2384 family)
MLMRAFVRFQRPGELMCWSWAFPLLTLLSAARFLGLKPSASELDYVDLVLDGLPLKSLDVIVKVVAPTDPTFKYRIVPNTNPQIE